MLLLLLSFSAETFIGLYPPLTCQARHLSNYVGSTHRWMMMMMMMMMMIINHMSKVLGITF